jgi:uncharacterized protein with PQ loop repeat
MDKIQKTRHYCLYLSHIIGNNDMILAPLSTYEIGTLSMNLSFILYLLLYLPQVVHNRQSHHIEHLSIGLHVILYGSYGLDLLYGFAHHLQWQYKTVSIVGLVYLTLQHIQITMHMWKMKNWAGVTLNLTCLVLGAISILYFFTIHKSILSDISTQLIGFLARIGFLVYSVPQILKNRTRIGTQAISMSFIYLSMSLSLLDLLSAWCLDWGWPNKLAGPIQLSFTLILMRQIKQQIGTQRPSSTNQMLRPREG